MALRFPSTLNDNSGDITIDPDRKKINLSGGTDGHAYLIQLMLTAKPSCRGSESECLLRLNSSDNQATRNLLLSSSSGLVTNTINCNFIHEVDPEATDMLEVIIKGDPIELFSPSRGTTMTIVQLR